MKTELEFKEIMNDLDERSRASGKSTRQIDQIIQDLFHAKEDEWVLVLDHAENMNDPLKSKGINQILLHKILTRLQVEHRIESIFKNKVEHGEAKHKKLQVIDCTELTGKRIYNLPPVWVERYAGINGYTLIKLI